VLQSSWRNTLLQVVISWKSGTISGPCLLSLWEASHKPQHKRHHPKHNSLAMHRVFFERVVQIHFSLLGTSREDNYSFCLIIYVKNVQMWLSMEFWQMFLGTSSSFIEFYMACWVYYKTHFHIEWIAKGAKIYAFILNTKFQKVFRVRGFGPSDLSHGEIDSHWKGIGLLEYCTLF
jgi:hypothetical protein